MAVPKYDEMMLPVLRVLSDGADHTQRELAEQTADHLKLTP
jgi:restriction endonuclease Mrr